MDTKYSISQEKNNEISKPLVHYLNIYVETQYKNQIENGGNSWKQGN